VSNLTNKKGVNQKPYIDGQPIQWPKKNDKKANIDPQSNTQGTTDYISLVEDFDSIKFGIDKP
jgi:hypothetical protein